MNSDAFSVMQYIRDMAANEVANHEDLEVSMSPVESVRGGTKLTIKIEE